MASPCYILLRGHGSNGEFFIHVFFQSPGIARRLPTAKFVFPTAKQRRAAAVGGVNARASPGDVKHVRDLLDQPPVQFNVSHLRTPVFLGHGAEGRRESFKLPQRMAAVLSDGFEMDMECKAYDKFGHWYNLLEEIEDMLQFVDKTTLPVVDDA
ncbi:hypothetical protein BJY04DRAFT_219771 [Aspergillus karnatakaensis]|uniref:uncharacterized protein n=1 Tax=Aspergillus karnatakaensis TaxID=1810916 RepID=UPI003CCD9D9F